jgi:hypothetical protein
MSNKAFKVFIGLVTAFAVAFALVAFARNTVGVSGHSIAVGSLGSAGCLAVILAFAIIIRRKHAVLSQAFARAAAGTPNSGKSGLVLFETKAPQPPTDVHDGAPHAKE